MSSPDGAYDWFALGAAGAGTLSLLLLLWLIWSLRRVRRAQKIVIGGDERDVVAHAASMQREFVALRDWIDEASERLDARMSQVENRLDGAVAHTAMLRYDAYDEMSGRQSSSVALLDEHGTGVVLSAILHRNHSHLYVKQLVDRQSDIDLSPEERKVVELAFAVPTAPAPPGPPPQPPRTEASSSVPGAAPTTSSPTASPANPQRQAQSSESQQPPAATGSSGG
ncbi:MAG: DUF4446 family protein [Solirubrobacterales bacterium]